MPDFPYWLALTRVSVLGARRIMRLIEYSGSARAAFLLAEAQIVEAGLPAKVAAVFVEERKNINPDKEWQQCLEHNIAAVTLMDDHYPQHLKQIYDPPPVLYYRGSLHALEPFSTAVVGSRKATAYGKAAAEKLSFGLAASGVCVVSGMARGIDTAAHLGALSAQGKTAAVLGCGLDICYPPENRKLRDRIADQGVIISEFAPGTPPKAAHFPVRNRIISGLSHAVVVVEAAQKSGALITADCALEQGREVFAVPGSINSLVSRGCHKLIKEGAAMVDTVDDILFTLGVETAATIEKTADFPSEHAALLKDLEYEPVHFDVIAAKSGLPAARLSVMLVELELSGKIKKLTGNYYLRV